MLSARELEVLRLISTGLSNSAIAEKLFISEHTVHRHVANTLTKLNVPSRSAAVALVAQLGCCRHGPNGPFVARRRKMTRFGEAAARLRLLHSTFA